MKEIQMFKSLLTGFLMLCLSLVVHGQNMSEAERHIRDLKETIRKLDEGEIVAISDINRLCTAVKSQPLDIKSEPPYGPLIYEFAELLNFRGYLQQSLTMCWEGGRRAKMTEDLDNQIINQLLLASIYLEYQNQDSARMYVQAAESRFKDVENSLLYNLLLNAKAELATQENRLYEALRLYSEVFDYFTSIDNQFNKAMVGKSIANVYYKLGNYKKAIQLLLECTKYFEEKKYFSLVMSHYINLGVNYSHIDSQNVAFRYYLKSLELSRKQNDSLTMARLYSNMGNVKRKEKEFSLAVQYQDSAYVICQKIQMPYGIFLNHINRAEIFIDQGKWNDALVYLQKAMSMHDFYNQPLLKVEIHELMSKAYEGMKDYSNALKYSKLRRIVQDSLDEIQSSERLYQLEQIYEQEKVNRDLTKLKYAMVQSTMRNRLMIFVLFSVLMILGIILYRIQARRRLDALQQQLLEEEKERLVVTVETRNNELLTHAMHQASIREMAEILRTELGKIGLFVPKKQKADIDALIQEIETRIDGDQWNEFETRFAMLHENFYTTLKRLAPELNSSELKICGFLRLNMSSKEIALLTQRTVATIDNIRSIIRKKLQLPAEVNLSSYLQSVDQPSSGS